MDNDDDILEEIRMKYAEDLEEILECPICLELPKGMIVMCTQGHHICSNCISMLNEKCPTCQSSFGSCRNYVAENLCAKFQDIQSSILDPKYASNRRVLKNKVSVYIQTESVFISTSEIEKRSYSSVETQTDESEEYCTSSNLQSVNMVNGRKAKSNDELSIEYPKSP